MKTIRIIKVLPALLCLTLPMRAQTVNWSSIEQSEHTIHVGFGWDYSLSHSLGYAYQVKTKIPLILTANFSSPFGKNFLDDFKTKMGGQIVLLNNASLKGSLSLNAIYRRYQNPLVRLQNFGSELNGIFGYYKPKWFAAGEIGFDKAIVTHFKHSNLYKEIIYPDVRDGWFEPATGGNFHYGLQTGLSYKKSDLTLNAGRIIVQDFETKPLIPFYFIIGYNYRID